MKKFTKMKSRLLVSLLVVAMVVMVFSGCQKNKSCEACKEYYFIYNSEAYWAGHLHGNNFDGMVMKKNIPNILKKHQGETINICAEIEIQDPSTNCSGIENVTKFKCVEIK